MTLRSSGRFRLACILGCLAAIALCPDASRVTGAEPSVSFSSPRSSLAQLGWTATALAASGCTASLVQPVLSALEAQGSSIAALATARRNLAALKREAAVSKDDSEFSHRQERLVGEISELLSQIRAAVIEPLPPECRARLLAWTRSEGLELPSEARVIDAPREQLERLSGALRACKAASDMNAAPSEPDAALVAWMESRPEVAAARAALRDQFAPIQAALVQ